MDYCLEVETGRGGDDNCRLDECKSIARQWVDLAKQQREKVQVTVHHWMESPKAVGRMSRIHHNCRLLHCLVIK